MKISLHKSKVSGKVSAPPSKSYTIRGLMCAALAKGESQIINPLRSEDTEAAMNVLGGVGVSILQEKDMWRVSGGEFHEPETDLFCGNSAATLRFMTAICSIIPGKCRLTTGSSLAKRPVETLIEALRKLGADCASDGEVAPVTVNGGKLRGGLTELPGDISSQYVSALMLPAPFAEEKVSIRLTSPLESKPYVMMTLECLERFGIKLAASKNLDEFEIAKQAYKPARYEVEGDWSSASYFLALGALSEGVEVANLNPESRQGDRMMLNFLQRMGAMVELKQDSVIVRRSKLNAISADLSDCIDLLPTVAALAALADGVSEFTGIERARLKESNRVATVRNGLERMGIEVTEERDRLTITGSVPKGSAIDTGNDHRIAMAFSILGVKAGNMVINEAECVNKTYPQFWGILENIGGKLETDGK